MRVLAVVNKKGGAGKTTTAIGLVAGCRARGLRAGLVDTDPNASASRWLASVPEIDTVPCAITDLAALIDGVQDLYDVLVIDSPPNDVAAVQAVAAVAHLVIIPLAPSPIEVDQLPDTVDLIEAVGTPWLVVPVRVRLSTAAGKTIRELCSDAGVPVTRSVVPLTEAISRAFGSVPPGLSYMPLLGELLDEHLLVGAP